MNRYGIIYKIRNIIDNKIYIGQTVQTFDERYAGGLYKFTHNMHLKNAICKYGINNFEIDKEFDIAYSKEELDKLEDIYIRLYDTTNPRYGYNKMYGGSNGMHTEETKLKMRSTQKLISGVKVICYTTNEVFDTIADASRTYNASDSEIVLCCKKKILKGGTHNGVPLQWLYYEDYLKGDVPTPIDKLFCVTTNEVFDTYEDAVNKYPTANISGISQCCSLIYNSCGTDKLGNRLQWLRYNDYQNGVKVQQIRDKRVICITTHNIFNSAVEASDYYHIDYSHLLENCKLKSTYCGELQDGTKLQWLYYEDYINGKTHNKIKDDRVICLNYNKVFKNAKEASVFYKLDKSCITKCCRGVRKSCGKDEFGNPMKWAKYSDYICHDGNKKDSLIP